MRSVCVVAAVVMLSACGESTRSAMRSAPAAPGTGSADREVNAAQQVGGVTEERLGRELRHVLVMLPYYGVFDNLAYRVDDGTVTLLGQVTRPTLKTDAENVVKHVEGVDRVVNNIRVLPLSPGDDKIRLATFRAIYGDTALSRYALQAVPPVHMVVENGNVTLEGVVATEADKNLAYLRASGVEGVFSVKNNLRVGA
jgi:hyperosmotically inducible periplasmic protein